jgi:hypothetical protein
MRHARVLYINVQVYFEKLTRCDFFHWVEIHSLLAQLVLNEKDILSAKMC